MPYPKPIASIDELPKAYEGLARERFWQQYWRECGVYNFEPYVDEGGVGVSAGGTGVSPVATAETAVPPDLADTAVRPTGRSLRSREEIYSVDTPPPTVSGALHIGHVFSYTQTDFSVRYQRMRGKHIFYPFGFDDNGLPSERLVERVTGKRAHEMGREAFIEMCRPILADAEQQFKDLWESLALSCDWSQFYTTIDARSRAISQASFIDLYNKGYVYRKEAPTMWCWADQTAIAQAEIEDKEVAGKFHDIVFKWADEPGGAIKGELIIATTRPELIPACVAVFAHPDDERYKQLFGKVAITPLFEVEVPILPSEKADPEKGTGILMCCTFGDMDDVEHWRMEWDHVLLPTRKLQDRVVVTRDGTILDFSKQLVSVEQDTRSITQFLYPSSIEFRLSTGADRGVPPRDTARYGWPQGARTRNVAQAARLASDMAGQKIKAAQAWIREELNTAGFLRGVREITHIVRHSERGGVPIEILLTPQWYIRILDFKQQLIEQGQKVTWHPDYMYKRFEHWVDGLNQDWCISRQRYNGVPFPVWYDMKDNIITASPSDLPINPLMSRPNNWDGKAVLHAEPDVMDTWATSSVTPLLNTHLVIGRDDAEVAARHAQIFPYDMRPQAHDIIRTWAFYTIVKATYHFGSEQGEDGKWRLMTDEQKLRRALPWKDIVISGHAQDAGHKKISKSKGHVVTPSEMVEKYTADGLRYWSSGCKLGTDTLYDEKLLGDGKRLITKLFNATKFALRHLLDFDPIFSVGRASSLPEGVGAAPMGRPGIAQRRDPNPDTGETPAPPEKAGDPWVAPTNLVVYPTDRWILARLSETIARATKAQNDYEFGDAKQIVEDFFWADFCDNYLELSKGRLYGEPLALQPHAAGSAQPYTPEQLKQSAQAALFICLSAILRLFAPILPHICEECWSWYFAQWSKRRGIHEEPWPAMLESLEAPPAGNVELLLNTVATVRKWHSESKSSIKRLKQSVTLYPANIEAYARYTNQRAEGDYPESWPPYPELLGAILGDLKSAANTAGVEIVEALPPSDAALVEGNPVAVACELAEEA